MHCQPESACRSQYRPWLEPLEDRFAPGSLALGGPGEVTPFPLPNWEKPPASVRPPKEESPLNPGLAGDTFAFSTVAEFPLTGGGGGDLILFVTDLTAEGSRIVIAYPVEDLQMQFRISRVSPDTKAGPDSCEAIPAPDGTSLFGLVCGRALSGPLEGASIDTLRVDVSSYRGEEHYGVSFATDTLVLRLSEQSQAAFQIVPDSAYLEYIGSDRWRITASVLSLPPPGTDTILVGPGAALLTFGPEWPTLGGNPGRLILDFTGVAFFAGDAKNPGYAVFGDEARVDGRIE